MTLLERLDDLAKQHDRLWMDTRNPLYDETCQTLKEAAAAIRRYQGAAERLKRLMR